LGEGKIVEVAVIGLGKIGLPLSVLYASKGHRVTGIDVNRKTVDSVNSSQAPFRGEEGLQTLLNKVVTSNQLRATGSFQESVPQADVIVVAVPLVVDQDKRPDFTAIDSATNAIGENLSENTLILYETTLPIGTTRKRLLPQLENLSNLREGIDFHLVFSPERVLSGRVFRDLRSYPKIIGGFSNAGLSRATDFYNSVLDFDSRPDLGRTNGVWELGSVEEAEMSKLAETTFRDVNIALANQFAIHADHFGIDIDNVIAACNSQPFSSIHSPGISVGGHCIPVYPELYLSTDPLGGIVRVARDINNGMPAMLVQRLANALGSLNEKRILILGLSYRPGVKEDAFSGTYVLVKELAAHGARPFVLDPLYSETEMEAAGLEYCKDLDVIDGIILHTAHPDFLELNSGMFPNLTAVMDGRIFLKPSDWVQVTLLSL